MNLIILSIFWGLGPEYGTTEAGWKGVCLEADRLGDLHLKIKDNLCNDVTTQIKSWQKESYHKVCCNLNFLIKKINVFFLVNDAN